MKFKVKTKGLINGMLPVTEVATKGIDKSFEGSGKITLSVNKNGINAHAFGGRVAIRTVISDITVDDLLYSHDTDGETTISATALMDALASFSADESIVLTIKKSKDSKVQKLLISKESDSEVFQALPCFDQQVQMPKEVSNFDKEVTLPREMFLHGFEKIFFSVGFETDRNRYLFWVFRADKNEARFVAGTGA